MSLTVTKEQEFKITQEMSGLYLTESYPDSWNEMDEEDQTNFLIENVWEPFESWDSNDVASEIISSTNTVMRILKKYINGGL